MANTKCFIIQEKSSDRINYFFLIIEDVFSQAYLCCISTTKIINVKKIMLKIFNKQNISK